MSYTDAFVYIAAPFNRKEDVRLVAKVLYPKGYQPCVRWLMAPDGGATDGELHGEALIDTQDIDRCDLFVLLNDPDRPSTTGGMHFETGYAAHAGKKVVLLGTRTPGNPFHQLFDVYERAEDIPDARTLGL